MVSSRSPRISRGSVKRFLLLLIAALVASVALPLLQAEAASDAATSVSLVNGARSSAGVNGLTRDARLDRVAAKQAQRMADENRIYHNPNLGPDADAEGVAWTLIGENVGVGEDVQQVHDAFMASSGHRANVEHRDYNLIGAGSAIGGDGSIFIAHVFARADGAAPKASAPKAIKAATPEPASVEVQSINETPTPATPAAAPATVPPAPTGPVDPTDPNALTGGVVVE